MGGIDIDVTLYELMDGLTEAVVVCAPDGVVQLVNAPARRLLPDAVVGNPLSDCSATALNRALDAAAGAFDGEHRGRRLRGLRRRLADGRTVWYVRDLTAEHQRVEALRAERAHGMFLAEAANQLSQSLDRGQTLRTAVTLPVPVLADCAAIVLPPSNGRSRWVRSDGSDGSIPYGRLDLVPGLTAALAGESGGPWRAPPLSDVDRLWPDRPGYVLVAPMPAPGGPVGALVAFRSNGFASRDAATVRQYAARAGAALTTAAMYSEQARIAEVLQTSLLPPQLPRIDGAAIAAGYRPARETLRIGGDFYDVFPAEQGGAFALGDVCGKGADAAVLSGRVRQSVHSLRMVTDRPLRLLDLLNKALMSAPDAAARPQFTTLLVGTFATAPVPGGQEVPSATSQTGLDLVIAGGGHPAPLVVRAGGTTEPIRVGGMPVGALPGAEYREIELHLGPGDLLLAYSDGVTEARGGRDGQELFGEARLRAAVQAAAGAPPDQLVDRVLRRVDEWLAGRDHDDIALLALAAG